MIDQLGAHLGKRIVFGYDRHLLPEMDGYLARLAAYGMVVTDTDPARLHYLSSAERVCRRVRGRPDAVGVLACMTGIGVSIAANKFAGVYAARCLSVADAQMARTINNANVLCLAVSSGAALNTAIVDAFMRTPYQGRKLDELAGLRRFERRTIAQALAGFARQSRSREVWDPSRVPRKTTRGRLRATEPDLRFPSVEQIEVPTLASRGITGLLADLDGTLVGDHQDDVPATVAAWVGGLRAAGIGVCIVSNSGPARVAPVAAALDVPYVANAAKPLRWGIDAGLRALARPANDVALVGDQLFTDVWGGRRSHLLTILVAPRSSDQALLTRLKRPLERLVAS
jgi:HAD superfamily phosphatase (TIGR01668 family)